MGIPYTLAHSSIRFSLSRYNSDADIDAVIEAMPGYRRAAARAFTIHQRASAPVNEASRDVTC